MFGGAKAGPSPSSSPPVTAPTREEVAATPVTRGAPTPSRSHESSGKKNKGNESPLDAHVHPRDPAAAVYVDLLADADAIPYPHGQEAEFTALIIAAKDLAKKGEYERATEKRKASLALEDSLRCAQAAHRAASNVRHAARRYKDLCESDLDFMQMGMWAKIVSHLDERIGPGPQSPKEKADELRAQRVSAGNAKGGRQGLQRRLAAKKRKEKDVKKAELLKPPGPQV